MHGGYSNTPHVQPEMLYIYIVRNMMIEHIFIILNVSTLTRRNSALLYQPCPFPYFEDGDHEMASR